MQNVEEIIKYIQAVLQLIFGGNASPWLVPTVSVLLLTSLILYSIQNILLLLSKITDSWRQDFWPLFYNTEQKRRSRRRRLVAQYIEQELLRLNLAEDWKDYRYGELEAEVEAEGRQRRYFTSISFLSGISVGLRREPSLAKALISSQERLILLEGEPGSGKSVALRHIAQMMANRAKKSRNINSIIPIYVNLRYLDRPEGVPIDQNLIKFFILKYLNRFDRKDFRDRAKDFDIEKFLDDEFEEGIQNGTWFFLFDSFDEVPEIINSTKPDVAIKSYADAIDDFLHGMNQCRGLIASRHFRGPTHFGWPRFRILPLSASRRLEMIRNSPLIHRLNVNL